MMLAWLLLSPIISFWKPFNGMVGSILEILVCRGDFTHSCFHLRISFVLQLFA